MPIDWWFLGEATYRTADVMASRGAPFNSEAFVQAFSQAIKLGIDHVRHVDSLEDQDLHDGVTGVLRAIVKVVEAYHRKKRVQINANYMVPELATDELVRRARFTAKDRRADAFDCFLVMKGWAHDLPALPKDVVLPVEGAGGAVQLLFGAPSAFARCERYHVRDTREIAKHIYEVEHPDIRTEVVSYFNRHGNDIRSFVSLPVEAPQDSRSRPLGVVNIQSNKPTILGLFEGNQRKLCFALLPFLHILAYHLERLYPTAEDGGEAGATA